LLTDTHTHTNNNDENITSLADVINGLYLTYTYMYIGPSVRRGLGRKITTFMGWVLLYYFIVLS